MDDESIKNNETAASAWFPIKASLERYDGQLAMDQLLASRANSVRTWNGCYWKAEDWFINWFRDHALLDDKFPFDDFGSDDFVRFLSRLYPNRNPAKWDTDDLPHMMHELREYAHRLNRPPSAPQGGANSGQAKMP